MKTGDSVEAPGSPGVETVEVCAILAVVVDVVVDVIVLIVVVVVVVVGQVPSLIPFPCMMQPSKNDHGTTSSISDAEPWPDIVAMQSETLSPTLA